MKRAHDKTINSLHIIDYCLTSLESGAQLTSFYCQMPLGPSALMLAHDKMYFAFLDITPRDVLHMVNFTIHSFKINLPGKGNH